MAQAISYPSLKGMSCPHCGATEYHAVSFSNYLSRNALLEFFFVDFPLAHDLVSNWAEKRKAQREPVEQIVYKCLSCKKKYTRSPLAATADDLLETPCTIRFICTGHAISRSLSVRANIVLLNGVKVALVDFGDVVEFPTYIRYNTVFRAGNQGEMTRVPLHFEAGAGGLVQIEYGKDLMLHLIQ